MFHKFIYSLFCEIISIQIVIHNKGLTFSQNYQRLVKSKLISRWIPSIRQTASWNYPSEAFKSGKLESAKSVIDEEEDVR